MVIFELLFLICLLLAVVALMTALFSSARRTRVLRRLGLCTAIYLLTVMVVSLFSHRKEYRMGDQQCFDEWCIMVVNCSRTSSGSKMIYNVHLLLTSRSRGRPQGEKGTVAYLTDSQGRRYEPVASSVPFDTKLQPGQSMTAWRQFELPLDARNVGMVYAHIGANWAPIIGENEWFSGPPLVWLE